MKKELIGLSPIGEWQRISPVACGAMAFVTGITLAFYIFPSDMLLDRWEWWEKTRNADAVESVLGYIYFAKDSWRWPITATALPDLPEGGNIVYTDSIPIVALIGKIIYNVTGMLPLYLGRWATLAYGMQAFLGWLIFRQLGLRPLTALVPALLVLMTPAFIFRISHFTLTAHWIILAAILFYIRAVTVAGRKEMCAEAVAIGSVVAIHPYLFAMAASVFLAAVGEAARRRRILWREGLGVATLMAATFGAWAFVLGIIGQEGNLGAAGFGYYSMNLASPVTPQISSIPGFHGFLDKTGGQYEGFNYLGGGALLCIIGMLTFRFRAVTNTISDHPGLAVVLTGLTIFAASSKLYIGAWYIGDIGYENLPVLSTLTSVFRSSGRFFWPVGYFAVIAAVSALAKTVPARIAVPAMAAAVVIQWVDIYPIDGRALPFVTHQNNEQDLSDQLLASFGNAAASHSEFTLFPTYHCGGKVHGVQIQQLQMIAARANIPVNDVFRSGDRGRTYLGRKKANCNDVRDRFVSNIAADSVTQNPLVVIFDRAIAAQLSPSQAIAGFICRDASSVIVCSRSSTDLAFTALGVPFRGEWPMLQIGKELSTGDRGEAEPFLFAGWSSAEGRWRWARGAKTSIAARLSKPVCFSLIFKAMVAPLSSGPYVVDRATVTLNGEASGDVVLTERGPHIIKHAIPLGSRCVQDIDIGFQFSDLRSPQELEINEDTRKLSWRFEWISITGSGTGN